MKSHYLLFTLFVLFHYTGNAQLASDTKQNFYFGIKGGVNISNIYDTQAEDFTAQDKIGFAGGAFFTIPIGRFLGFQPEALFSQKGYNASGKTTSNNFYSYSRTTSHIDFPLQLQIKPFSIFSLVVGPQYSYMIYKEEVFRSNTLTVIEQNEIKNSNLRKNTLGIVGGIDVYIFKRLTVSGRVGWDLQDNNGDGTNTFPRYRNTWLQATIGLRF